jgi:hypothetical protein
MMTDELQPDPYDLENGNGLCSQLRSLFAETFDLGALDSAHDSKFQAWYFLKPQQFRLGVQI